MNTYIIAIFTTGVAVVCLWLVYLLNQALNRNRELYTRYNVVMSVKDSLDKEVALLRKNPDKYTVHTVGNRITIIAHHDKYISVVKTFDITEDANMDYINNCAQELADMLEVNP